MLQYYVCDLDNGELVRGIDSILVYRTYASSGFHAIVAYSKDCGQRKRMAAYVASPQKLYAGRVKLFGDKLIASDKDSIEIVLPICKVEQSELPF